MNEFQDSQVYVVKKNVRKRKLVKIYLNEGAVFHSQQTAEFDRFDDLILGLESRIQEKGYGL